VSSWERRSDSLGTLADALTRVLDAESMLRRAANVRQQSLNDVPFALL
jgi:hypothetical protein